MTRRRLALGIALAVLVAAGAVWWATLPRPGITEANCARIRPGMRLEEVQAILGYRPAICGWETAVEGDTPPKPCAASCGGEEGTVSLDLNDDEKVASVHFTPAPPPSVWERLRRWLRR